MADIKARLRALVDGGWSDVTHAGEPFSGRTMAYLAVRDALATIEALEGEMQLVFAERQRYSAAVTRLMFEVSGLSAERDRLKSWIQEWVEHRFIVPDDEVLRALTPEGTEP
jgi:hypothetical protein